MLDVIFFNCFLTSLLCDSVRSIRTGFVRSSTGFCPATKAPTTGDRIDLS